MVLFRILSFVILLGLIVTLPLLPFFAVTTFFIGADAFVFSSFDGFWVSGGFLLFWLFVVSWCRQVSICLPWEILSYAGVITIVVAGFSPGVPLSSAFDGAPDTHNDVLPLLVVLSRVVVVIVAATVVDPTVAFMFHTMLLSHASVTKLMYA